MTLAQGQILHNRYRIVKLLGQGGFGAVYKAWDLTLNRPCAIKESFELSLEGQRQFLREAQILANLTHPNLPRVTDFFAITGQGQYLVMDYVEGQDLEELRCASGGKLPEAQALGWIVQVCEALNYLHQQRPPVIHRDIKPANIKITPAGQVMLVDFGLAKTYDPMLKTTLGARAVTPGYSPFEQYGTGVTDPRTDLYALGATLYTLLTGQEPPEAPQRVVRDPLVPPHRLNPGISPAVEAALLQALKMDPQERYQSAGELRAVLRRHFSSTGNQPLLTTELLPTTSAPAGNSFAIAPRPFAWKWVGMGVGLLAGLVLVVVLASLVVQELSGSSLTQTAQARASQTAEALAAFAAVTSTPTPSPLPFTFTPSPPPPTLTSSPIPPTSTVAPTIGLIGTQISPVDGMVMSYIPAGSFLIGSDRAGDAERPVHTVILDAFWMDQTEVTIGMYARCVASRACVPPRNTGSGSRSSYYGNAVYANYPVISVDWNQALDYCTWAGRELPTEAQWEYAARGGLVGASYPWGEGIYHTQANYGMWDFDFEGDTSAVGSYPPTGYGLYDMVGNVSEWVADWYSSYSGATLYNPRGPVSGDTRVNRGGSWVSNGYVLRVSVRVGYNPFNSGDDVGFRCARSP